MTARGPRMGHVAGLLAGNQEAATRRAGHHAAGSWAAAASPAVPAAGNDPMAAVSVDALGAYPVVRSRFPQNDTTAEHLLDAWQGWQDYGTAGVVLACYLFA